jgi:hypothetical protein
LLQSRAQNPTELLTKCILFSSGLSIPKKRAAEALTLDDLTIHMDVLSQMTVKLMRIEKNHIPAAKGNCQRNREFQCIWTKEENFALMRLKKKN